MTKSEALDRILGRTLLFEPGTDEAYSNSGYTLLAAVIESVTAMAFIDAVREWVFEPAGMTASGVYGEITNVQSAIGYDADRFGCNAPSCWPSPTWALIGNGGLVSTADDLGRWVAAVDAGRVFTRPLQDTFRSQFLARGRAFIGEEVVYFYSGLNDFGFGAAVAEVPGRQAYVVVTNNAAGAFNTNTLLAQVVQVTFGALIEFE